MDKFYQVTTIAGNGQRLAPYSYGLNAKRLKDGNALEMMVHFVGGICVSNDNRLYAIEQSEYRSRVSMIYNNKVTTVVGSSKEGFRNENALDSILPGPHAICISKDGKLYITDMYYHIIGMVHNNQVSKIAGNGQIGYKDGKAFEAMFNGPCGICISNDDKIYVLEHINNRIRMIFNNQVTTIAGNGQQGFKDGNALEAMFNDPRAICVSKNGRLYIADSKNHRIRMIYNDQVTTIAGNGQSGYKDGKALEAILNGPFAICCSNDDRIYVSEQYNHTIRMIYNGKVATIAGNSEKGFEDGNALSARFWYPGAICISNDGIVYVHDAFNHRIRMIYQNLSNCPNPFGFALLLDMQNTFCDCQISFNNVIYHLHSRLINVRCPLLLDQSYFSLLQQSNISNESFDSFVTFLYSNKFTKEQNQTWKRTISIKSIVEMIFLFDLLLKNCKSILQQLKRRFTNEFIEALKLNQQESMRELIVDLLPLICNLKQLIKTRPIKSNITTTHISYTEYCYNLIVHELKQRRSTVEEHLPELEKNMTDTESYTRIFTQLMSEQEEVDTTIFDDESMIDFGFELTELSKLAFQKTNICKIEDNNNHETISESTIISTQHLDAWTRPDFVIKLSNDDDDDNISYHVHKIVLCGRWKYFCQMIESGMKESQDNEMTLSDDWNKSRFEKMMKYIYLNEIEFDSFEDIAWLMENRKLYGITVHQSKERDIQIRQNNDMTHEIASYGFEDLYEQFIGVLR